MKSLIPLQTKYTLIQEALVNPDRMMGSRSLSAPNTATNATGNATVDPKVTALKDVIDKVSPIKIGELEAKYKEDPRGVTQNLTEIINKLIDELKTKNPELHNKLTAVAATGNLAELQKLLLQNLPDVQTLQQGVTEGEMVPFPGGTGSDTADTLDNDTSKSSGLWDKIVKSFQGVLGWFQKHPSVIPGVVGLMAAGPLGMVALPLIAKALTKGGSGQGGYGRDTNSLVTFIDVSLDKTQTENLERVLKRAGWDKRTPLGALKIDGILDSATIKELKEDPYLIANVIDTYQGEYQIKYKKTQFVITPIAMGINITETSKIKTKFNVVANKTLKTFDSTSG